MSRAESHKKTRAYRKNVIPSRTLFLDKERLKQILLPLYGAKGVIIHAEKNLPLKPEIIEHTNWIKNNNWGERIYCIINDICQAVKCKNCGGVTKFAQRNIGYHEFCSRKCSAEYENTKEKRAITNIKKYGDIVAFRNEAVKPKQKETLMTRYGVSNSYHLKTSVGAFSKISQELFWNVWSNSKQCGSQYFAELNAELRINVEGRIFKPDYAQIDGDDKRIIEFDGDYWHSGQNAVQKDFERDTILTSEGWRVIRIRESDYLLDKEETIMKCIAFLNRQVD
jgi:hypothetical protein